MSESRILPRCGWAALPGEIQTYHDAEWGTPCHDEARLFEMLILEGKQAGLSWSLILRRREGLRGAFDNFDPEKMAHYDEEKMAALLIHDAVIKNRRKIAAAVSNARAYLDLRDRHGSLDAFLWRSVDGAPIVGRWPALTDVPTSTPLSDRLSKDLKKLGFSFVGTTIVYSYMQAVGLVDDHVANCFRCPKE
jgi:DNA-3-methyladenine glycosylase I